jgi:hypothetical protein
MEVTVLSVPNPRSYLICAGIAEVENRGFATEYRGPLYIHSTGRYGFSGMPDMSAYPVPVIHEFNDYMNRISEMEQAGSYISIPDGGVRVELKNEEEQADSVLAEYALLADVYRAYRQNPAEPFFHVKAIIGKVDLLDVVDDADSPWAQDGYKHWILGHAVLFAQPITGVTGSRTALWTYEVEE